MAKFCSNCGKEVNENAVVCVNCGCSLENNNNASVNVNINNGGNDVSAKSRLVAFLLCTFLGGLGIHRFYVGKVGTGIVWLLTLGLFGIGSFIDWILILCGTFKDIDNRRVVNWN